MEIKKIDCPSCGAPVEWNSYACGFCNTELRFFLEEGAVLPLNLNAGDVEKNIVLHEKDFWNAAIKAIDAPYSLLKGFEHYNEQDLRNEYNTPNDSHCLNLFFKTLFIMPSENCIAIIEIEQYSYALLTSLRLIIYRDTILLSIPLENYISWKFNETHTFILLKYFVGDNEKQISFGYNSLSIQETVIASVIACKEWLDLNPIQKNLLTLNRYTLNKVYKIEIKTLTLMDVKKNQPKKACFVATATMGNYNHPIVIELQHFRDHYLINKSWGIKFIDWYYKNGPVIANHISKSIVLKKISLWFLIKPLTIVTRLIKH